MRAAIGLLITVVALFFAARRGLFIFKLVKSGVEAPNRRRNIPEQINLEVQEVLGQKLTLRVWFNGRTSASQAEDAGSIPVTRSKGRSKSQNKSTPLECSLEKIGNYAAFQLSGPSAFNGVLPYFYPFSKLASHQIG